MKSTENTAKSIKSRIEKLVKYLVDTIVNYHVYCTVKASDSPASNSKYVQFQIGQKQHVIRVSDRELPAWYKPNGKHFHDLRPDEFKKGKFILTGLLRDKNAEKNSVLKWKINLRGMVEEYEAALEKQKEPAQFKKWSGFVRTINAISPKQKWKLYKKPLREILDAFKLPQQTPPWIGKILVKYF